MGGWVIVNTILIIFLSFVLCRANPMHLCYDSTVCSWEFPHLCQLQTCLEGRRQERVPNCTFILDAKLTMVRCFSLFCWAVLSSGRLSLLAAQSHPPQKSRHKIKLGFLYGISTPFPHIKSTTKSLMTLHLFFRQMFHEHLLSSLEDHVLPKKTRLTLTHKKLKLLKIQAWMHKMMTNYPNGIVLFVPFVTFNQVQYIFTEHLLCARHNLKWFRGTEDK